MPAALVLAVIAAFVGGHLLEQRDLPRFPGLAGAPDPSLHGTVAYYDARSGCVRAVAAAGAPDIELLCLPPLDARTAASQGKPVDPQLIWRSDGRLEVTGVRMTGRPAFVPDGQRVVDVTTGQVDVAPAEVPASLTPPSRVTTRDDGADLAWSSDPASGLVSVTLRQGGRERTLLSAHGPSEYTYGLDWAAWSPDGAYVLAFDGRLLVLTTDEPAVTRILVDRGRGGLSDTPEYPSIAITGLDLLARDGSTS